MLILTLITSILVKISCKCGGVSEIKQNVPWRHTGPPGAWGQLSRSLTSPLSVLFLAAAVFSQQTLLNPLHARLQSGGLSAYQAATRATQIGLRRSRVLRGRRQ